MRSVWLHVHVPKAGGSTLRQLMNRTFGEGYYNSNSLLETKQYTCEDVSEIVRCHPWVQCFSDHKLSMDLPYNHEEAKVHALAYVRDPVERFISRYFFHRHFEEVNCIAQKMSFRDFANAELVEQYVHPQTNSQIYFLNQARGPEDMTIINKAIATGQAHLFPIERFDESCICMERLYPTIFSDLSYVFANKSKKDSQISEEDRDFVKRYLRPDYEVFDLSHKHLDETLARAFHSDDDRIAALEEFKDRCSRRYHNFKPPVAPGMPLPQTEHSSSSNRQSEHTPHKETKPHQPKQASESASEAVAPAPVKASTQPVTPAEPAPAVPPAPDAPADAKSPTLQPKPSLEPKPELEAQPVLETKPTLKPKPSDEPQENVA